MAFFRIISTIRLIGIILYMFQTRQITFNKHNLIISYRDDSDLSVIDEFFVDKMYRSVDPIITNATYPLLDIGAHIGVFSLYARALNPAAKIIAIEPEPHNFDLLKENFKLNRCENVIIKQMALVACHPEQISHNSATTTLYLNKDSHNHSTFYKTENSIEVLATTLEDLMYQNKIKKIGLLKMDIEGGEFEITHTMTQEIYDKIQNLAIEYHEFEDNKRTELEQMLRMHGFSVEHFPNAFDKRFGLLVGRNKRTKN